MKELNKINLSYILNQVVKSIKEGDYMSLNHIKIPSNLTIVFNSKSKKAWLVHRNIIGKVFKITIEELTNDE